MPHTFERKFLANQTCVFWSGSYFWYINQKMVYRLDVNPRPEICENGYECWTPSVYFEVLFVGDGFQNSTRLN